MFFNELSYTVKVPDDLLSMKKDEHSVRLSYGCKVFERDKEITSDDDREFLGIYFNLSNNLTFSFDPISGTLHKDQYIFIYLPDTHAEFNVRKGKLSTLGFHFTLQLLKNLAVSFPFIEPFLEKVERKQACTLTDVPLQATEEMLHAIKGILLYNIRRETDRNIHFFSRVFDILTLCLEQLSIINNPGYKNYHYDQAKIRKAQAYLTDHLQEHFTLGLLADKVGMEMYTLARAFKKINGKTIMDFLAEERMKKATALLRGSNLTLQQIAQKVGYKNHTHFTKAFKRKLNCTPSTFRYNAFNDDESMS